MKKKIKFDIHLHPFDARSEIMSAVTERIETEGREGRARVKGRVGGCGGWRGEGGGGGVKGRRERSGVHVNTHVKS